MFGLLRRSEARTARLPTACVPPDAGQCETLKPGRHARTQAQGIVGMVDGQGHGEIVKGGSGGAGDLHAMFALGPMQASAVGVRGDFS